MKRPELTDGPKKVLNAALHDLHGRAGLPSVRELVDRVGGEHVAGRSRIHDAFSSPRLPAWGLVQILVEALASKIPGADAKQEELRLHQLWLAASGQNPQESEWATSPVPKPAPAPMRPEKRPARQVLAMKVEWVAPALLDIDTRRTIRDFTSRALDDIGLPARGKHRKDGSAGSVIMMEPGFESPSMTAAMFLATLDDEQRRAKDRNRLYSAALRFMAFFDHGVHASETLELLNDLWSSPESEHLWNLQNSPGGWRPEGDESLWQGATDHPLALVSAVLYGLPYRGDFAGEWDPASNYVPFAFVPPGLSDFVLADAWVRVSKPSDPWSHLPF
ncbi:hypothetical protein [Streptomyces sp. HF10]|uniref:hypothetical protein n=1 Tax=Streptomyces sp. HF10 TaxID=2692233 RepID=UPI0013193311|nr:hypothetical protein [Streptomyces sp. HF10]QHC32764.1 hypothetical protein GR129_32310 [Streptomyces sp. HF10]